MIERRRLISQMTTAAGVLCVVATVVLTSAGVRTVRAEGGPGTLMSVDPELEAKVEAPPSAPALPAPTPAPAPASPATPGAPSDSGIIVLNTQGYNYGPPPGQLEREALRHETPPAR